MNNLSIFAFEEKQIRAVMIDGEPWFVASDVASILGYAEPHKAVAAHCKYAKSLKDIDGMNHPIEENQSLDPKTKLIPESDVYRLIIKSRLPAAEAFEKKLMEEILPEIRRTGGYNLSAQTEYVLPKNYVEALKFLVIAEEEKQVLLEQVQELKPKAEFRDYLVSSTDWYDMKNVAKILFDKYHFKIGRNKLFESLRNIGILMQNNEPYQQFVNRGLFKVILHEITEDGTHVTAKHTVANSKGIEFIYKTLIKNNIEQDTYIEE